MDNKGKITIFLCLMMSLMLLLGVNVIKIIEIKAAKAKAAICANTAMSSAKAGYNRYIFDNYHILLLDKNLSGGGEAYFEEMLKESLKENLGSGFKVKDVIGTRYTYITDNDCRALKEQIKDYMVYAGIDYGIEQITAATDGKDGSVSDEVLEELAAASDVQLGYEAEGGETDESKAEGIDSIIGPSVDDPRNMVGDLFGGLALFFVLPEGEVPSTAKQNILESPSFEFGTFFDLFHSGINTDFDDIDEFKSDLTYRDSWLDSLADAGAVAFYARNVFNCITNKEVNENTVFQYELEYLAAGRNSDSRNISRTVNELISLRLPVNFCYLISDGKRMSQVKTASISAALLSPIAEPVIRYLIAGCWAYIESVVEVRHLLAGERLPFLKNSANWITDITNLDETVYGDAVEDENGLCYEDYITILLAVNINKTCLRMLDLMELNARQEDKNFQIEGCVTEFSADFLVDYKDYDCSIGVAAGY